MKNVILILIALVLFGCGASPETTNTVDEGSGGDTSAAGGSSSGGALGAGGLVNHDGTGSVCSPDPECRQDCCATPKPKGTGGAPLTGCYRTLIDGVWTNSPGCANNGAGGASQGSGGALGAGGSLGAGGTVQGAGGDPGAGGAVAVCSMPSVCDSDINPSCPVLPPQQISYCNVYTVPCVTTISGNNAPTTLASLDFPGWSIQEIHDHIILGGRQPDCNPADYGIQLGACQVAIKSIAPGVLTLFCGGTNYATGYKPLDHVYVTVTPR